MTEGVIIKQQKKKGKRVGKVSPERHKGGDRTGSKRERKWD